MKWDIIVVGAGPVGSYLSFRLAEAGYRALLLDRKRKTGRQICAGVIGAEAFQKFPLSIESVLWPVKAVNLFSPSGKRLRHATKTSMAYVVDRVAFDQALLREALERGAEFINLSRVVGVEQAASGIKVVCSNAARKGERREFMASMAVFATGYNPGLMKALGLSGYPGAVVGIQRICFMEGVNEVEVYLGRQITPGGFAWLIPLGDKRVRVGLVADKEARFWLDEFTSHPSVASRIVRIEGALKASWIPKGPIPKTYGNRFLVLGEAAGQVKVTTYGGVYYGLICADKALETITHAFERGDFGEDTLCQYQLAWLNALGEELEFGSRMREKVIAMEDSDIDTLFAFLGSDGLMPRLRACVRFDWHKEAVGLLMRYGLGKSFRIGKNLELIR